MFASCIIFTDTGELYSFGCNDEGQLGCDSGSEERVDVPTKITLPIENTCIKMLSAGVYHSACLTGLVPSVAFLTLYSSLCIVWIMLFVQNLKKILPYKITDFSSLLAD